MAESNGWLDATRASYDRVVLPYAAMTREAPSDDVEMARCFDTLVARARAGLSSAPRILDAGSGPGWWAGYLADLGAAAVALDASFGMTAFGQMHNPSARFVCGAVGDLPFADAVFDAVVSWYVMHHLTDAEVAAALDEVARVLRPGGAFLLGGHVGAGSRIKTEGYGQPMNVMVNKHSETWWEAHLEHAGFTIDDRRAADGHHAIHARLAQ